MTIFHSGKVSIGIEYLYEKEDYDFYYYSCVVDDGNIMTGEFRCRSGYTEVEVASMIVEWRLQGKGLFHKLVTDESGLLFFH